MDLVYHAASLTHRIGCHLPKAPLRRERPHDQRTRHEQRALHAYLRLALVVGLPARLMPSSHDRQYMQVRCAARRLYALVLLKPGYAELTTVLSGWFVGWLTNTFNHPSYVEN